MIEEIKNILEFDISGDPITGMKLTRMTLENVAHCLKERLGIHVSATTVRRLLTELECSLKGNCKSLSSGSHPDRDKQLDIIKNFRKQFRATDDSIISVDTKKKELIGLFKNPGRVWKM